MMKKIIPVMGTVLVLSCHKKNADVAPAPFLNLTQTTISVSPLPGTSTEVIVQSNIDWQLSFSAGADFLKADKMKGHGNDTIHINVLTDNGDSTSRKAILTASPTNTATQLSTQLTIEQKAYNVQLLAQKVLAEPVWKKWIL